MRVAAIDCGTNSIRLLIADIDGNNFREIVRDMEIVRLGQGVDQTGHFHPDAIARTLAAVDKFAAEIAKRGVEKIRFCATSATRMGCFSTIQEVLLTLHLQVDLHRITICSRH